MRYALYFVPHKLEREKLALKRRQLCKRFENRKAVMYPIHLTLVKEFRPRDPKSFLAALRAFCAERKPIKLKAEPRLGNGRHWGGVVIQESAQLIAFQEELEGFCAGYGDVEPFAFQPHISLVYAKDLPSLGTQTSPVKKLILDRVTLALQTVPKTPFRVAQHAPLRKP